MASLGYTPEMLAGPAATPAPGYEINLVNPPSNGNVLIIVSSVLLAFMLLFVFNRIYAKLVIAGSFGWEDGTCIVAALFTLVYYATVVISVTQCHVGVHQWDVTLRDFLSNSFLVDTYLAEVLSAPSFLAIKITFFLLYLQLFRPIRALRIAIWVGAILTTLVYVGFTIAWFVLGTPTGGQTWQQHLVGPEQAKGTQLSFPIPAIGLVTDIYIFILPFIGIWKLQMQRSRKIGIALIFITAILAVVASILRLVYTAAVADDTFSDLTYNIMPVYLTVMIEMNLGVMITCMPALSQSLRHWLPGDFLQGIRSRLTFSKSGVSSHPSSKIPVEGWGSSGPPHDNKHAGFVRVAELNNKDSDYELGRYSAAPKTYISAAGGAGEVEEDKVHLRYEIEQETYHDGQG